MFTGIVQAVATVSVLVDKPGASQTALVIAAAGLAAGDPDFEPLLVTNQAFGGGFSIVGIPLLSLRVITDTPNQPFPAPSSVLFDIQQQRTHIAVLARFFLAHPNRVPGLVQFARRIARARKTLADALVEVVRTM